VRESTKVNMALLEEKQARELFMFHAFKHANGVTNDFENISMEIIKACGGLPLSLEILLLFAWYLRFGNMKKCIMRIERWAKYNKGL
jgi:hypothetical protein